MADILFNLSASATTVLTGVVLDQPTVHQQADYDEAGNLLYVTQVVADGVTLPGETAPPDPGVRLSRGDLAINRVDVATGTVTGVMYVRSFDHGAGIGVEVEGATTYLWLAYDAVPQPPGTPAHGRRIARLPFAAGTVVDPSSPSISDHDPIPGATAITPGLDIANGQFAVAYATGGAVRYRVFDLAQFKAKNFTAPLADYPRLNYPDFQSWQIFNGYVYQLHGTPYGDENPEPPTGSGDVWWTVVDSLSGALVERVHDLHATGLDYREPGALSFWNYGPGPQLVFGYSSGADGARLLNLYALATPVTPGVTLDAVAVTEPEPAVQLTVTLADATSIQTWQIYRQVQGTDQLLFSGTGDTLPDGSTWLDTAAPGCIPLTYRVIIQRTTGEVEEDTSPEVTFVPAGGCSTGGQAVGEETNVLGCPSTYSAQIHWRGGALPFPVGSLDRLTEVSWSRTINDVAEASITVLKGNLSPECCEAMGQVEPWVHELSIYRDGELVWQGPITKTTARRESIQIDAKDVFAWLDKLVNTWRVHYRSIFPDAAGRRRAHIPYIAWNHIRLNLTDPTLSTPPDYPSMLDYIIWRPGDGGFIQVERDGPTNELVWTEYVGNLLREWTKYGLTWTTIGRTLLLRGMPNDNTRAQGRLTMEDFSGELEVVKDGDSTATHGFASNQDPQDLTGRTVIMPRLNTAYGRLDRLIRPNGEDDPATPLPENILWVAALSARSGRYPTPLTLTIPDGSALTPTAPVKIGQLVPGERFDVLADAFCTPVVKGFMLSDVEVSWQNGGEKVAVTFIPLGDVPGALIS